MQTSTSTINSVTRKTRVPANIPETDPKSAPRRRKTQTPVVALTGAVNDKISATLAAEAAAHEENEAALARVAEAQADAQPHDTVEDVFSEPAIGSNAQAAADAQTAAMIAMNPEIAAALTAEPHTGIEASPPAAPVKRTRKGAAGILVAAADGKLESAPAAPTDREQNAELRRLDFLAGKITRGAYYQAVKALRGEYRERLNGKELADKMESLRVISEAAYAKMAGTAAPTRAGRGKQADPAAKLAATAAKLAAAEAHTAKLKADLEALAATAVTG
jgi:hypothetical protein